MIVAFIRTEPDAPKKDDIMDMKPAPALARNADTTADRRNPTPLFLATLTAGIGASLLMSGLAHAEPMMSAAQGLSETTMLKQVNPADHRLLFGILIFGFSLLAAGVWHRSFRAMTRSNSPSQH